MTNTEQENTTDSVVPVSTENQVENTDEFIRITAALQMLSEAQTHDEQNNYAIALHFYRVCVDFLLEELMFSESTEQSRTYLQEKCTAIMDRIDLLKSKLDPVASEELTNDNSPQDPSELQSN